MNSKEIAALDYMTMHQFWLKEIAWQLAIMNERQTLTPTADAVAQRIGKLMVEEDEKQLTAFNCDDETISNTDTDALISIRDAIRQELINRALDIPDLRAATIQPVHKEPEVEAVAEKMKHESPEEIAEHMENAIVPDVPQPAKECTREAGHDGPCNGYPRDIGLGVLCFKPKLRATRVNLQSLQFDLFKKFQNGLMRLEMNEMELQLTISIPDSVSPAEVASFVNDSIHVPRGTKVIVRYIDDSAMGVATSHPGEVDYGKTQWVNNLKLRLSQYYPGFGKLDYNDEKKLLTIKTVKEFRHENKHPLYRFVRVETPIGITVIME